MVQIWIVYLFLLMLAAYVLTYLLFGIVWYILYVTTDGKCVKFAIDEDHGFLAAYMFSLETQARLLAPNYSFLAASLIRSFSLPGLHRRNAAASQMCTEHQSIIPVCRQPLGSEHAQFECA
jgi:hypothetical protein